MTAELTLNTKVYYHVKDHPGVVVGKTKDNFSLRLYLVVRSDGNELDQKGELLSLPPADVSPRKNRYTPKGSVFYRYHHYKVLWDQLPEYEWKSELELNKPGKRSYLQKVEKEQNHEHSN